MSPPDFNRRALMRLATLAAAAWTNPMHAFAGTIPLDELAHSLLVKMRSSALSSFLSEWPAPSARRTSIAASLPVLRYLPMLRGVAPPFSEGLVGSIAAQASDLAWRRSYVSPDVNAEFLENYGWTEIVGLTGPLPSEHLACGALVLGPRTTYPPHHHEAEEIYVPLAGVAKWKQGSGDWLEQVPGTVIHHQSGQSHAMRTEGSPLLALYLWRSDNLAQKSQIDHDR